MCIIFYFIIKILIISKVIHFLAVYPRLGINANEGEICKWAKGGGTGGTCNNHRTLNWRPLHISSLFIHTALSLSLWATHQFSAHVLEMFLATEGEGAEDNHEYQFWQKQVTNTKNRTHKMDGMVKTGLLDGQKGSGAGKGEGAKGHRTIYGCVRRVCVVCRNFSGQ